MSFSPYRQQTVELFKIANIKDKKVFHYESVGCGALISGNVSVFDNAHVLYSDITHHIADCFLEAEGVFKSRCWDSINPMFLFKLPEEILKYLGISPESAIIKIFNLIWWFVCLIGSICFLFLQEYIKNYFVN